ncbi:GIY-YIG nuclease family protein [Aliiglaciecola litoralis]|uniref:GIY-YIG domain-containing protein n=1 Tax=Aliiglaciecola litoralis TaxID=582857 RepID=A0ABN1LJJ6_9ALTE
MQNQPWTLYLVRNNLGNLYCGICTDLARRFSEHASGGKRCAKALKGKGPLVLEFATYIEDRSRALKLEYWLKQQSRAYKLALVKGHAELPEACQRYSSAALKEINQQVY